jgi:hypothetical protein
MTRWARRHFGCTSYHPLFVFNQLGDAERCALRPGNVHSADGWRAVLEPVVARYRGIVRRLYFHGNAAFANPEMYEFLEAERLGYTIRLPANGVLEDRICACGTQCAVAQDAEGAIIAPQPTRNRGNVGIYVSRFSPSAALAARSRSSSASSQRFTTAVASSLSALPSARARALTMTERSSGILRQRWSLKY